MHCRIAGLHSETLAYSEAVLTQTELRVLRACQGLLTSHYSDWVCLCAPAATHCVWHSTFTRSAPKSQQTTSQDPSCMAALLRHHESSIHIDQSEELPLHHSSYIGPINSACFCLFLQGSAYGSPKLCSLYLLGASWGPAIAQGAVWRLMLPMMLHATGLRVSQATMRGRLVRHLREDSKGPNIEPFTI